MAKILDVSKKAQQDSTVVGVQLTLAQVGFVMSLIARPSRHDTADLLRKHAGATVVGTDRYQTNVGSLGTVTTINAGDVVMGLYVAIDRALNSTGLKISDPMKEEVKPSETRVGGALVSYPGFGNTITVGCESGITKAEVEAIQSAVSSVVKQLDGISSVNNAIVDTMTIRSSRLVQVSYNRNGSTKIIIHGLDPIPAVEWNAFVGWVKSTLPAG